MLRRTVSTAFVAPPGETLARVDPGAPRSRGQAVSRLFSALHSAFGERIASESRVSPALTGPPVADEIILPRLGRQRTLPEGFEFVLETRRESYRFLDTLAGSVEVSRVVEARLELLEVLSVQRSRDGYRPICKSSAASRAGFEYTTVPALVGRYTSQAVDAAGSLAAGPRSSGTPESSRPEPGGSRECTEC